MLPYRRFQLGEELALFEVYYSAIHLIAKNDYSDYSKEQLNAWAPLALDRQLWVNRINGINPFVAEIEGQPIEHADIQQNESIVIRGVKLQNAFRPKNI